MISWLVIIGLLIVANVLFARALDYSGRAFRDWGTAHTRRQLLRHQSSPSS